MFAIAGQTAGPNWRIFLRELMGTPGFTQTKKLWNLWLTQGTSANILIHDQPRVNGGSNYRVTSAMMGTGVPIKH